MPEDYIRSLARVQIFDNSDEHRPYLPQASTAYMQFATMRVANLALEIHGHF